MALMAKPMASPHLQSAFSPYSESPSSPHPFTSFASVAQSPSAAERDALVPPSPYPATVDPSPVESKVSNHSEASNTSNLTDTTDFEIEDAHSTDRSEESQSPGGSIEDASSPASSEGQETLAKLDTKLPRQEKGDSEDGPVSVIHAPSGFKQFVNGRGASNGMSSRYQSTSQTRRSPPAPPSNLRARSGSSPSERSESTIVSPSSSHRSIAERRNITTQASPINTAIPPEKVSNFGMTPRASTRQEAEEEFLRRIQRGSKNLEDIAEGDHQEDSEDDEYDNTDEEEEDRPDGTSIGHALEHLNNAQEEIGTLKNALSECWTLCNTLAGLSSNHRERMFSFEQSGDMQEQAWRSCWRLCQNLYESREEDHGVHLDRTLELCREFCQALFEARQKTDEALDSILRVSFELNNHLYNTHDSHLPLMFRERTMDFYITMCHRLMKQRTSLPEETDSLLRACWSLAEMLFSLRQNSRDHKPPDEELLGSAVQACWELCDLFREGWTQIRPDRSTPRPTPSRALVAQQQESHRNSAVSVAGSSISFAAAQALPPSRPSSSLSHHGRIAAQIRQFPPETPTTLFDETGESPIAEPPVPNIMVLGPSDRRSPPQPRHWSSSASSASYKSESSQRTSSTATAPQPAPGGDGSGEPYLPRLKALILKAAMNAGYSRSSTQSLQAFVSALPPNAFGTLDWQLDVVQDYRKLVLADPSFRPTERLPSGRKSAAEVARAVQWLAKNENFDWLRLLFQVVFGFAPEKAAGKTKVWIQT